jgi:hypothetical protein
MLREQPRHNPKSAIRHLKHRRSNLSASCSFFVETQRVSGAELSELLIKDGFGVTTGGLIVRLR